MVFSFKEKIYIASIIMIGLSTVIFFLLYSHTTFFKENLIQVLFLIQFFIYAIILFPKNTFSIKYFFNPFKAFITSIRDRVDADVNSIHSFMTYPTIELMGLIEEFKKQNLQVERPINWINRIIKLLMLTTITSTIFLNYQFSIYHITLSAKIVEMIVPLAISVVIILHLEFYRGVNKLNYISLMIFRIEQAISLKNINNS